MPETEVLEKDDPATVPAVRRPDSLAQTGELTCDELVARVRMVHEVLARVMAENVDYGRIPGCGDKPTLLKPGAEKLCMTFRLAPSYRTEEIRDADGHLTVIITCTLTHITSGLIVAEGLGRASTRESKYAYRQANRKCPRCGGEAIIKGKAEYGGGWLCFAKKGGCGAKFNDGDKAIEGQGVGRVANEDLADQYNTVLKMGAKRAFVAATLSATAASSIFTQDLEDMERPTPSPPQAARPETNPPPKVVSARPASAPPETKPETKAGPGDPVGANCENCGKPLLKFKSKAGVEWVTCWTKTEKIGKNGKPEPCFLRTASDYAKHLAKRRPAPDVEREADGAGTESPPDESGLPDTTVFDPPEPPKCPGCGSTNLKEGHAGVDWDWQCRECATQFSK